MRLTLLVAALISCATTAQAKLELDDIQASHGQLGPVRETLDYYPSDEVYFRFTINGAEVDEDGKVAGVTTLTFVGPDGSVLYKGSGDSGAWVHLGNSLPTGAGVNLPVETPAGRYTLTVLFRDKISGEEASFRRTLNVMPAEFAATAVRFFRDADGKVPAPAGGLAGEPLYFRLQVIGFDATGGRIDLANDVQVLDAAGQPTSSKPTRHAIKIDDGDVARNVKVVNLNGYIFLNCPGDFTLRFESTDLIAKKTTKFEVPMSVKKP